MRVVLVNASAVSGVSQRNHLAPVVFLTVIVINIASVVRAVFIVVPVGITSLAIAKGLLRSAIVIRSVLARRVALVNAFAAIGTNVFVTAQRMLKRAVLAMLVVAVAHAVNASAFANIGTASLVTVRIIGRRAVTVMRSVFAGRAVNAVASAVSGRGVLVMAQRIMIWVVPVMQFVFVRHVVLASVLAVFGLAKFAMVGLLPVLAMLSMRMVAFARLAVPVAVPAANGRRKYAMVVRCLVPVMDRHRVVLVVRVVARLLIIIFLDVMDWSVRALVTLLKVSRNCRTIAFAGLAVDASASVVIGGG